MEKLKLIITQKILVEVDMEAIQNSNNYKDAMSNGNLKVVDIVDCSVTTEDGLDVLDDDELRLILQNAIVDLNTEMRER